VNITFSFALRRGRVGKDFGRKDFLRLLDKRDQ
jgi:hypothetical protein